MEKKDKFEEGRFVGQPCEPPPFATFASSGLPKQSPLTTCSTTTTSMGEKTMALTPSLLSSRVGQTTMSQYYMPFMDDAELAFFYFDSRYILLLLLSFLFLGILFKKYQMIRITM